MKDWLQTLQTLVQKKPIVVVQPGISRQDHSDRQATIMAAAHSFLTDTVGVPLDVMCAD